MGLIYFLFHPPLEGEGRLASREARCETGWGESLSTRAPFKARDCHPTPPLISFASTLPLQGRVKRSASPPFARRTFTPLPPPVPARRQSRPCWHSRARWLRA